MKKLVFRSLLSFLLILTKIVAMETPSFMENIPEEVKLGILKIQNKYHELILNSADVINCMQINRCFNELAKKGELWVLLSKQDGFICHKNTAFQCHYNYLKGLKINQKNPEFKDTELLEESIRCFNKAAPFMHEGSIKELLNLMNSPHIPLETKCTYLPEDWNFETCALLTDDQILAKSDDDFIELLCESNFYAIYTSKIIAERLYAILNQKGLSILADLLKMSALSEEKGDDLTKEIQVLLTNFDERVPGILIILERAKESRDFLTLDLLIYLLDIKKNINEDSEDSSSFDTNNILPLLDEIKNFILLNASPLQMGKMSTFLQYISENDLNNEYEERKTAKNNDIPSPYREAVLSVFRSGTLKPSHFLINGLSWTINLYNPDIVISFEPLWNYFYFMEKEIAIKYPSIICYDFVLPDLTIFAWNFLDDISSPLYKRQFLILQKIHKTGAGNIICPGLIDTLLEEHSINFSADFWQKHLAVNSYNEFKNDLFKSLLPKILTLSEMIKNRHELSELYNLLIIIYLNSNNLKEAHNYAEKALKLDLNNNIYKTTIVENLFSLFLNAGEFKKAEETLKFLPPCYDQEKQDLMSELNDARNDRLAL